MPLGADGAVLPRQYADLHLQGTLCRTCKALDLRVGVHPLPQDGDLLLELGQFCSLLSLRPKSQPCCLCL